MPDADLPIRTLITLPIAKFYRAGTKQLENGFQAAACSALRHGNAFSRIKFQGKECYVGTDTSTPLALSGWSFLRLCCRPAGYRNVITMRVAHPTDFAASTPTEQMDPPCTTAYTVMIVQAPP